MGTVSVDEEDQVADLSGLHKDEQIEAMRTWFLQEYEDPAHRTPYESSEGGYIWIWGGPYDAREVLECRYGCNAKDQAIDELVDELEGDCMQWAPTANDYDDYSISAIANITDYYHNFAGAILDVNKLMEAKVDVSVNGCFMRLLYVNVITALETYLSDAFISTVVNDETLKRRFVETTPYFQKQDIPLSKIYQRFEQLESEITSHLSDTVWHRLAPTSNMYKDTLGIEFPANLGDLYRAVNVRHDIVHRNGQTKDGNEVHITVDDITDLIGAAKNLIQEIDGQLSTIKDTHQFPPNHQ